MDRRIGNINARRHSLSSGCGEPQGLSLINGRIRGQVQAVAKVLPWIRRLRFGLPRDNRPAAVFLLLGPTGTGKTQLARELARSVYGSEDAMLFLEMGQYQKPRNP